MLLSESEEKALVNRAKKDPSAFGELFELHFDKIFKYVLRRTGNVQVAEDITADVFCKALDKLWQFTWQSVPFSAWLYRIASNDVHAYFRKGLHVGISLDQLMENSDTDMGVADLRDEIIEIEKEIEKSKEYKHIQIIISELPHLYQDALSLRFFEEKKVREIGIILNKKEGTVKSLISRGVGLIRQRLERDLEDKTQPFNMPSIMVGEGREKLL